MTYYNLSFMDNSTSLVGIVNGINSNSNNMFAILLLLTIYILLFIVFSNFDIKKVMVTNSFIVSLLAGSLYALGWIQGVILSIPVTLLAIGIFILIWSD